MLKSKIGGGGGGGGHKILKVKGESFHFDCFKVHKLYLIFRFKQLIPT